jgi:hypothetical protein
MRPMSVHDICTVRTTSAELESAAGITKITLDLRGDYLREYIEQVQSLVIAKYRTSKSWKKLHSELRNGAFEIWWKQWAEGKTPEQRANELPDAMRILREQLNSSFEAREQGFVQTQQEAVAQQVS